MTQGQRIEIGEMEARVGRRVRALRLARGWSLEDLANRCWFSPSTLSRMETGHQRIGLDQLTVMARALGTTLDHLVAPEEDEDVVIRPSLDELRGTTTWVLSRAEGVAGRKVAKIRLTRPPSEGPDLPVHPGRDWFTVLSGTVLLVLGDRRIRVETGQAAEFSTLVPHAFGSEGGPAEILVMLDPECVRASRASGG